MISNTTYRVTRKSRTVENREVVQDILTKGRQGIVDRYVRMWRHVRREER